MILGVGSLIAFIVSIIVIKFLLSYIKNMISKHLVGIELFLE